MLPRLLKYANFNLCVKLLHIILTTKFLSELEAYKIIDQTELNIPVLGEY